MRTQEEIIARFHDTESEDDLGVQKLDLISLMTFENAKPFLTPDYVKSVEDGTCPEDEKWGQLDVKAQILDYLPYAYKQAIAQDGARAARSIIHFKTWMWFDDDTFYKEMYPIMATPMDDFGLAVLDMIAKHYGYKEKSDGTDTVPFEEIPSEMSDPASNKGE